MEFRRRAQNEIANGCQTPKIFTANSSKDCLCKLLKKKDFRIPRKFPKADGHNSIRSVPIKTSVNPYIRRYRHLSASLFGDIFWMTTKCANLINFEHPRGAKWLEKCIVFDKKCLPSEKGLLHRRNHCGILPYQNSYHEMHKRPNFEALWTSVRLETKIEDNFFHKQYTFCDLYTSIQLNIWVCGYRINFSKPASFGITFFM